MRTIVSYKAAKNNRKLSDFRELRETVVRHTAHVKQLPQTQRQKGGEDSLLTAFI